MKTILAALDSSGTADAVVTTTAELSRAAKARVVLLAVVQPPVITSEYTPLVENISEITAAGVKAATQQLASIKKRLNAAGVNAVSVHALGAPTIHIVEQAKKYAADYIVMGSHGHTAFYDLLVGSTTHGVLRRAQCPVVIVPSRPKARAKKK